MLLFSSIQFQVLCCQEKKIYAQKSYKDWLPLCSSKKKGIFKLMKLKVVQRKDWKHRNESWYWHREEGETILILFYMNSKRAANFVFVFRLIQVQL